MSGWFLTVEQQCPQCGAPIELTETDRLLVCPYCRARLCIHCPGPVWLFIPPRGGAASGQDLASDDVFYLPYWRFRGVRYVIGDAAVSSAIVDHSLLAAPVPGAPASLGIRPQALLSRFVHPGAGVRSPGLSITKHGYLTHLNEVLRQADRIGVPTPEARLTSRSVGRCAPAQQTTETPLFIGEAVTVLCSPFRRHGDTLWDGLTGEAVGSAPDEVPGLSDARGSPLSFHASLCPDCGHDLDGQRQALVLVCTGCAAAWQAGPSGLVRVPYELVEPEGDEETWVPFWRITLELPDLGLLTLEDMLRFANQRVPVTQGWLRKPLALWLPATKAAPESFLRWARIASLRQRETVAERLPDPCDRATELYPVTLPASEAIEALPIALASICVAKRRCLSLINRELLRGTGFMPRCHTLVMVPFRRNRFELVQRRMGITMHRATLDWGRGL